MSDPIEKATSEAIRLIAARAGFNVDAEQAVAIAREGVEWLTELVDGHAKKHAAAAGEAAAAKITTLAQAEESESKR